MTVPNLSGLIEIIGDVLYSRVDVAPLGAFQLGQKYARHETGLFRVPVGLWGFSSLDTNMLLQGSLPTPHRFIPKTLRCLLLSDRKPLSLDHPLWWNGIFEFYIGEKIYVQCPIHILADPIFALSQCRAEGEKIGVLLEKLRYRFGADERDALDPGKEASPQDASPQIWPGESFYGSFKHQVENLPPRCELITVIEGTRYRGVM